MRLNCVFRFTLHFHLHVPCLVPFKVYPKEVLAVRTSYRKEVLALLSCNCKEVLAVSRTQSQATRNQPLEEPLLADAKRSSCVCIIFGLHCILAYQPRVSHNTCHTKFVRHYRKNINKENNATGKSLLHLKVTKYKS